jgi:hypothetical protein
VVQPFVVFVTVTE